MPADASTSPRAQETHLDILDGFRGIAILMVATLHIWQLSWLDLAVEINGQRLDFNFIATTGFMGVELFLFISGFCLFLPHARHMVYGKPLDSTGVFFFKRAIKIVPSYLLACFLIIFIIGDQYFPPVLTEENSVKQVFTHLLFIHNWFRDTYGSINGVFWSLGVEVQFYYLFPIVALLFRKSPWVVAGLLIALSAGYRYWLLQSGHIDHFYQDQLIGLIDMFCFGMLGAYLAEALRANPAFKDRKLLFTAISMLGISATIYLLLYLHSIRFEENSKYLFQANNRTTFGFLILVSVVASTLSVRPWRLILANPVLVFFSRISYNWYIWHQLIGRWLVEHQFPLPLTENPREDPQWRLSFTVAAFAISIAFSTLITYWFEQPILNRGKAWLKFRRLQKEKDASGTCTSVNMHFFSPLKKPYVLIVMATAILLATLFLLYSKSVWPPANGNLLKADNWAKVAWQSHGDAKFDPEVRHEDGGPSVRISTDLENDISFAQTVPVTKGKFYRFSSWVRVSGIEGGGANLCAMDTYCRSGGSLKGDTPWTYVEQVYQAEQGGDARFALRLGYYGATSKGTAWFAAPRVEELNSYIGDSILIPAQDKIKKSSTLQVPPSVSLWAVLFLLLFVLTNAYLARQELGDTCPTKLSDETQSSFMRFFRFNQHSITAIVLFVVTLLTYWISSHNSGDWFNYHVRLAEAMLQGRLDYGEFIAHFELAEWKGKYYTVNPPLPAILLIPFVYIWGVDFHQPLLSIFLGACSVPIAYFVILKLFDDSKIALWTSILFAFGSVQWYHAETGSGWYVSQVVGLFFVWCGIYGGVCRRSYFFAGLAIGAALLSRIPLIACIAIIPFLNYKDFVVFSAEKKSINWGNWFKLGAGVLPGLIGLMLYNYLRFGTVLNKAYDIFTEQHKDALQNQFGHLSVRYIGTHLQEIFSSLPYFTSTPPYMEPNIFAMAIWVTTPAFVFILAARYRTRIGIATLGALILAAIPSLIHGGSGYTQYGIRYTLDYMPMLLILTASGLRGGVRWPAKTLIIASIVMSVWGVTTLSWLGLGRM